MAQAAFKVIETAEKSKPLFSHDLESRLLKLSTVADLAWFVTDSVVSKHEAMERFEIIHHTVENLCLEVDRLRKDYLNKKIEA